MKKGQALIPLLIIIVIILGLGTTAIELAIGRMIISRFSFDEIKSFYTVETAMENAFLKILRNPAYLGEDLQINDASCTIEVSVTLPKVVNATCDNGRQVRKMEAEASFVDGVMVVENIREIE